MTTTTASVGEVLGGLQRGDDGHAGGAAHQQAFLAGQPAGHGEGVGVADGDDVVRDGLVVVGGPHVLADAFDEVRAGPVPPE